MSFLSGVKFYCTKCGALEGRCDCWELCSCGWTAERGKPCRNPETTRCSTKLKYGTPPRGGEIVTLPPYMNVPPLSDLAARVLDIVAADTLQHQRYTLFLHIAEAIPELEATVDAQGTPALRELRQHGLIERMPGAHGSYRLTPLGAAWALAKEAQALRERVERFRLALSQYAAPHHWYSDGPWEGRRLWTGIGPNGPDLAEKTLQEDDALTK